jgi:hypothetical protein
VIGKNNRDSAAGRLPAHPRAVVPLPVFEQWEDCLIEWLDAASVDRMSRRKAQRLARSMRHAVAELVRVKKSPRHENLAVFLKHAAHSLECGEFPGARYILTMAHALLSARAAAIRDRAKSAIVLQLPLRAAATTVTGDTTGIVAG